MLEFKRDCLIGKYHRLSVKDCPYEMIVTALELGNQLITIENYDADATIDCPKIIRFGLGSKGALIKANFKRFSSNFELNKEHFMDVLKTLNFPAFYSVCHEKSLKFTATDLDDIPRYKALDNFGWNLEISTPNNSIEYAFFTSPYSEIIDKIEENFKN